MFKSKRERSGRYLEEESLVLFMIIHEEKSMTPISCPRDQFNMNRDYIINVRERVVFLIMNQAAPRRENERREGDMSGSSGGKFY